MSNHARIQQFLPKSPAREIPRDNVTNLIERLFKSYSTIWLEGTGDTGKTVCLRQFAEKHADSAVALFVSANSVWSMDWNLVRADLYDQINAVCGVTENRNGREISDADLQNHVRRLIRYNRTCVHPIYFVVDGLDGLPEERTFVRDLIISCLPLNIENFKFLFSATEGRPHNWFKKTEREQTVPVFHFSATETETYLRPILQAFELTKEIWDTSKGHPGHLAAISRFIEGETADVQRSRVAKLPQELPQIFALEWDSVSSRPDWHDHALAIIAIERESIIENIAAYLNIPAAEITKHLKLVRFVSINEEAKTVRYISESFRNYAQSRLQALTDTVNRIIIDNLLKRPDDDAAFETLPRILSATGKHAELLEYLSADRVQQILTRNGSCAAVIKRTELGISGARTLKRDGELLRLCALRAALVEVEGYEVWRDEIEAYVVLGNYTTALALAERSPLKPQRLRMLAIVANKLVVHKREVPPELVAQIRALYAAIDFSAIKGSEIEIASDLLAIAPEIAIELVEKSKEKGKDEARNLALAQLSLLACAPHQRGESEGSPDTPIAQRIRERITDETIKSISVASQILFGTYTVERVLLELQRLDSSKEQLFLLEHWIRANLVSPDAWKLTEYGLVRAIKSTEITPNAALFATLAAPLKRCNDEAQRKILIAAFDAQRSNAEQIGPSVDFVRLQLHLAAAEVLHDQRSAVQRVMDAYFFSAGQQDFSVKVLCFVHLKRYLSRLASKEEFQKEGIVEVLDTEISQTITALLQDTADHYAVLAPLLKVIATYDPELAYHYSEKLNTHNRRNRAKYDIGLSALKNGQGTGIADLWRKVCNDLRDTDEFDKFMDESAGDLERMVEFDEPRAAIFDAAVKTVSAIYGAERRCSACCCLINAGTRRKDLKWDKANVVELMLTTWTGIDEESRKLEVGYRIVASIGASAPDVASELMEKTRGLKVRFPNSEMAEGYFLVLLLASRAYGGLVGGGNQFGQDYEKLSKLIGNVPSSALQIYIWCDFAMRCHSARRTDLFSQLVRERISPILEGITDNDRAYKWQIAELAAVPIFLNHNQSGLRVIESLPRHHREAAIANIVDYITTKTLPEEPYDRDGKCHVALSYDQMLDLCFLAERASSDWTIASILRAIADSTLSKEGKRLINNNQRATLRSQAEKIVAQKVPSNEFKLHEGYRILCDLHIARIVDDRSSYGALVERVRAINNAADRAYLFTEMAATVLDSKLAESCAREAKQAAEKIPVDVDRIEHYLHAADELDGTSNAVRQECLVSALREAFKSDSGSMENVRRRVIDLVHSQNPAARDALITALDTDIARGSKRRLIEEKTKEIEARKKLADVDEFAGQETMGKEHSEAAWRLLGSLNANRVPTVKPEKIRQVLAVASSLPLHDAFPVLSWAIENSVRRHRGEPQQAQQLLRPLFEATIGTARMMVWLGEGGPRRSIPIFTGEESASIFIGGGSSAEGKEYVDRWIRSESDAKEFIICDPYFTKQELGVLMSFKEAAPRAHVIILAARGNQQLHSTESLEDQYRTWWRVNVSADEPCQTTVVLVSFRQDRGRSPLHDRWILGESSGIRLGTSLNSLSGLKLSELSAIEGAAFSQCRQLLEKFAKERVPIVGAERVDYLSFTL